MTMLASTLALSQHAGSRCGSLQQVEALVWQALRAGCKCAKRAARTKTTIVAPGRQKRAVVPGLDRRNRFVAHIPTETALLLSYRTHSRRNILGSFICFTVRIQRPAEPHAPAAQTISRPEHRSPGRVLTLATAEQSWGPLAPPMHNSEAAGNLAAAAGRYERPPLASTLGRVQGDYRPEEELCDLPQQTARSAEVLGQACSSPGHVVHTPSFLRAFELRANERLSVPEHRGSAPHPRPSIPFGRALYLKSSSTPALDGPHRAATRSVLQSRSQPHFSSAIAVSAVRQIALRSASPGVRNFARARDWLAA